MDKYVAWVNETKINNTIKSLENNNMKGYLANNKDELIKIIDELTNECNSLSYIFTTLNKMMLISLM